MSFKKFAALTAVAAMPLGFATAAIAPADAHAAPAVIAKVGTQNSTVKSLQVNLVTLGYMRSEHATGYYGSITKAAVSKYQAAKRLQVSGTVNKGLYDRLASEAAAKRKVAKPAAKPAAKSVSGIDKRCLTGKRVLCVNKNNHRLYYISDGKVIDDFSVRTGRAGHNTRNGQFSIYYKNANHWSTLYDVKMPYSMFFDGGEAVHFSSDFANNGYGVGSHGCVNMRDYNGIKMIFNNARIGDKVVVYGAN